MAGRADGWHEGQGTTLSHGQVSGASAVPLVSEAPRPAPRGSGPGTDSASSGLRELAQAYGVATAFTDWRGRHVAVGAATLVAVLGAFGVDASTEAAIDRALTERRLAPWRRMLPPLLVTRAAHPRTVEVHVPHGHRLEIWIELEDGAFHHGVRQRHHLVPPREVDGGLVGEASYDLPPDLPYGWHRLHARAFPPDAAPDADAATEASAPLVVVPDRLSLPGGLEHRRGWGFAVQLYSVRSRRSWGIGDLTDLAELAAWSGRELGAAFVLVNPVHAQAPVPPIEPSPYLPTTRGYADPLYLRVEAVPEYAYLGAAARERCEQAAAALRAPGAAPAVPRGAPDDAVTALPAALLDRDAAWAAKDAALRLVHQVPRGIGREAAYRAFRRREGAFLLRYATWCVIAEEHGLPAVGWAAELRDPASPAVARLRERHADRIDYHCWLQWLLDEQLAAAQRAGREAGMRLGVLHDLAVGVHPEGADAWAHADVLAAGMSVGAPPDAYAQIGQDWSQPPWRPDRLAEVGYAPFRHMVRSALRHGGGVRVDHVMGLFRLWWVPAGMPPSEGTYVAYDHEAMVGILALEAHRAGASGGDAVVVGEDLGTVEPHVRDHLAERGILGTTILWFEQDDAGPIPPERWRSLCLASVTTHDLPPTLGLLAGDHVALRDRLGLLTRSRADELREHDAVRGRWLALLRELGLLPPGADGRRMVEAFHRLLVRAPSRLLGVALADAVGDRRTQNLPGTSDEYPNWRIPLCGPDGSPVYLEDLPGSARLISLVDCVRDG